MRRHVRDSSVVHHIAELPADVVRRMWCPDARGEQQRLRVGEADLLQACPDGAEREPGKRDPADRAGTLGMILPVDGFALPAHDRSRDPHRRDRRIQVEVAESDREDFTDARRGAQHDLHDLTELTVRSRACLDRAALPRADPRTDRLEFVPREDVRGSGWAAELLALRAVSDLDCLATA